MLNRCAVTIRAKQPFLDWLFSLPDLSDLSLESINRDRSVYLLPEVDDMREHEALIRKSFMVIFESELGSWWTDDRRWPALRSLEIFHEWFEVEFHTVIRDLAGDEPMVDGRLMANTWQGNFPYRNDGAQGVGTSRWVGSSPVGTFPPNDFGLFDMIGNVWEWTTTLYSERGHVMDAPPSSCCPIPAEPDPTVTQVLKGGSHLCAPEYCHRYRPAARSPQSQDSSSTHIGFRCLADLG